MIGMRDRLVHHYFGIDWDLVADVIRDEIPLLDSDIAMILNMPICPRDMTISKLRL